MGHSTKERTFSWVDLLLLSLLVLILFSGSLFLLYRFRREERAQVQVEYLVLIPEVDFALLDCWEEITIGTPIKNANGTAVLGVIEEIKRRPSKVPILRDGSLEMTELPNRFDLYLKIRTEAKETEGQGLRVCDIRIAAGADYDFRVGGLAAKSARVVYVEVTDEREKG